MLKIFVDASQDEQNRVVIINGHSPEKNNIVDYFLETNSKNQTKGNIYLAKVEDVQPSLQAAFVNYGGGRYGFLPFSDIHPQYYDISDKDKKELISSIYGEPEIEEEGEKLSAFDEQRASLMNDEVDATTSESISKKLSSYKIEDVIKKGQPILVQVQKEERGLKGVRLTTYLSFTGRCCVFMPNSRRSQRYGVSRKISNGEERRRLVSVVKNLEIDTGTTIIMRTSAQEKTDEMLTADYNYLKNLWQGVYKKMMDGVVPSMIYKEDSLILRVARDMITKDVLEVFIYGQKAYDDIKEYYEQIQDKSADEVIINHTDKTPLFLKYKIESQLENLVSPVVPLPSGGEIVIDQAEALVAIDVNSFRARGDKNIEDMALKNNCEAAEEIAKQLRLRDLAGLIVIDFIDMEKDSSNRKVEETFVASLRRDRSKLQVGIINEFGLMILSRQRMRPSIAESVYIDCPHCKATGLVPTVQSASITMLNKIEEKLIKKGKQDLVISVPDNVAIYLLNQKRHEIRRIEESYYSQIVIIGDNALDNINDYKITQMNIKQSHQTLNGDSAPLTGLSTINDVVEAKKTVSSTITRKKKPADKNRDENKVQHKSIFKKLVTKKSATKKQVNLLDKKERNKHNRKVTRNTNSRTSSRKNR
ncbi:MAG: Rne/Rng family ribonuclease [Alphaproteobacteria bacterium]|nr:Rne/Rng family ribonuclease [Alphaproteobacteria bacterium]MBL0718224.1 Rne/Rng family ribonuclease [Alphaproteobacteria bacterium]